MRKHFLLFLIAACIIFSKEILAQDAWYVSIKTGLNIREQPDVKAKVLGKIPYGTKISLLDNNEAMHTVRTEGMLGYWRKVSYENKTGYIIDSYLFPLAPPKSAIKTMKEYLAQLSIPHGSKLVVKTGDFELQKQLYKNGAEWHSLRGHEYGSDTYFLPGFTIKQAFLLARMIPEFKDAIGAMDEFPIENRTYKKGDVEYYIRVDKEMLTEEPWIKRINIDYGEGAVYSLEIYQLDDQVILFFGSGV